MSNFNKLSRTEMKNVMGGLVNPCPAYCEPMGGTIVCTTSDGLNHTGNCNTLPAWQQVGAHNHCENSATGNFAC
jgi:putative hemolysin